MKKTIFYAKLFTFGCMFSALLITSCSEETLDTSTSTLSDTKRQTVTLAPDPGDLILIEGTTDARENTSLKRATNAAGDDRGRFNITLKYVVPVTAAQEAVFEEAAARWERIIIKDVPSFTGTIPSAFVGFPPAIDGTADDIVIEVALAPIDGPGGILGSAGPRFVRTVDYLTLSGVMFFDVDDLAFLDQLDLFEEVIVHEMGHVLGVGTLWSFNRSLLAGTFAEPYFAGKKANVHWNAEGGTGELPVENIGGQGTRFSHWRESVLNNELMTGFLNLGENPLSRITAGSLRDLGYGTAMVGEQYDLPKGAPGVDIDALTASGDQGLNIAEMETILEPIGMVTTEK